MTVPGDRSRSSHAIAALRASSADTTRTAGPGTRGSASDATMNRRSFLKRKLSCPPSTGTPRTLWVNPSVRIPPLSTFATSVKSVATAPGASKPTWRRKNARASRSAATGDPTLSGAAIPAPQIRRTTFVSRSHTAHVCGPISATTRDQARRC